MAADTLTIRMDPDLKEQFNRVCNDLGMSMSTAVTLLAKKMTREYCLPFEVSMDPFYSESNIKAIKESLEQAKQGKLHTFTWEEFEALAKKAEEDE